MKSGYAVNLYDVLFTDNKGAVEAALQVISGKLVELKEYGLLSDDQVPEELVKNVTPTDNLKSALTGVLYVQVWSMHHSMHMYGVKWVTKLEEIREFIFTTWG